MCRYAITVYKPHYACLTCHKAFRRRLRSDIGNAGSEDRPARCPQCGLLMANMGLDFKPPKKDDAKGWDMAAKLWEVGLTFHSCGCGGPGYRPRDPHEYRAFLEKTLEGYLTVLRRHMDDAPTTGKGRARQQEAIATWRENIKRIEAALVDAR